MLRLAVVTHNGSIQVVRHDLEDLDLSNPATSADVLESIRSMVEVLTEGQERA